MAGDDGAPLQGVLIKPGGYVEGERYPVLVYFYRLFSQRLHRFGELAVNHRPSFPFYASHGYAIFLPDVRFEVGRPGHSATRALTSGIQHLVEMGIADPDAIGLHGHSWSGYQTAFVITQTDPSPAAVAGAPVSNMVSAYGGIRYGSGLARMFQYEQSQSRMGASCGRDATATSRARRSSTPTAFEDTAPDPVRRCGRSGAVDAGDRALPRDAPPRQAGLVPPVPGRGAPPEEVREQARLLDQDEGVLRPLPAGRPGARRG
jgi:hypothetical protein